MAWRKLDSERDSPSVALTSGGLLYIPAAVRGEHKFFPGCRFTAYYDAESDRLALQPDQAGPYMMTKSGQVSVQRLLDQIGKPLPGFGTRFRFPIDHAERICGGSRLALVINLSIRQVEQQPLLSKKEPLKS